MDLDDLISDMLEDKVNSKAKAAGVKKAPATKKKDPDELFEWGDEDEKPKAPPPKLADKSKSAMPTSSKRDVDDDSGWGHGETFGVK